MRHATLDDGAAVNTLLERCASADGRSPLSEFKQLRVPVANGVRSLVAEADSGGIIALGVAAWHAAEIGEERGYWAGEIAVDPALRSVAMYESVIVELERDLAVPLDIWVFDREQEAAAVSLGMVEKRAIEELRRPLPAGSPELPAGLTLRAFEEGVDEKMWLVLNQRVFAHHPEAGSIDSADLALRMAQPWFDPEGLLILSDGAEPIGYCWTKVHAGHVGEIYMIGLVPAGRGRGLARPLTLAGLEYLSGAGATSAMLFADSANRAAIGLYESMGFAGARRVALFGRIAP